MTNAEATRERAKQLRDLILNESSRMPKGSWLQHITIISDLLDELIGIINEWTSDKRERWH